VEPRSHCADVHPLSDRIRMQPPPCRHDRVRNWMAANDLDVTVAADPGMVAWLSGYSRYFGGMSAVVINADGRRVLVVPRDEVPVAERLSDADQVTGYGERGFGLELNPAPLLYGAVAGLDTVASARRVGVVGSSADLASFATAEVVRCDSALRELSLVKDADELARIHHAYELCWIAQAAVAEAAAAGATEIEIMTSAQSAAQVAHGSPIDFAADLLAGPDTADVCGPIAIPGQRRAESGMPVIADICVGADGYWADTCRTHLSGPNPEVEKIYQQLEEILTFAARDLRAGASGAAVFSAMRDRIVRAWPDGDFPHHGGHGVGLTVFEDPHVIPADNRHVQNWMVMALEPGIYFPGRFGVRRENLYLVTPEGGLELTKALARPLDARAQTGWAA
jgi:Xaa-Pro aminopeptidase